MKYIRLFILSVFVFFTLALIVSIFIPSQIRVFRMVHINADNDSILNMVKDLGKWKNWYAGFENVELKNIEIKNGNIVKATANDVLLEVKTIQDSSVIVSMQKGDRPIICGWQINKDFRNDSLALQQYMDFNLKWYPWEKFSSLMLDKNYGDQMLQGLNKLKNIQ